MFMNQTTPPWPETDGGARAANYGRVDMTDRNGYGRKQALLLNCERVTRSETSMYETPNKTRPTS